MAKAYFNNDTIIAIATAPQAVAAIGIVRLSGAKALEAFLQLATPTKKKSFATIETHKFYRCHLKDHEAKTIDDAMFVFMQGPHSFTGEDIVEIHLHGNPYILQRCVSAFLHKGLVRAAQPGEFSFRAFQNGKMDLSQAEAVSDLIASKSDTAAAYALNSLLGNTKSFIDSLKSDLVRYLAEVEVDIDFSDQGLSVINYNKWCAQLEEWRGKIEKAREHFARSSPLREGIRVSLVGEPNSGKSTLFNLMLGENRSIVSATAGTTRDVVRDQIQLGSLLLLLSDTAGLRETTDHIEAEGIARSYGEVSGAHLVLLVLDVSVSANKNKEAIERQVAAIRKKNEKAYIVLILNKQDLLSPNDLAIIQKLQKELPCAALSMCAKSGEGLKQLENQVLRSFSVENTGDEGFQIGRTRHYELLGTAAAFVGEAIEKVGRGETLPDLLSGDLRAALSVLGEITGEVSTDDVLNYIFAEFCIGK